MSIGDYLRKFVKPKVHEKFEHLTANITDDDETLEEIEAAEIELKTISGVPIVIEYQNAKGERSQRLISCSKLAIKGGKNYLDAFCHQCESHRTFRTDRIIDIFDPETGESLSPVEAYFAQFSVDETTKSGLSWGLSVKDRANLIAFLNALVFVARCDKEYHPLEREAFERAITGYWLREELRGDPDCEAILRFADRLAPDGETFWIAMHGIQDRPSLVSHFKRSVGDVIAADGMVKPEESYWAVEIEQFFG